MKKGFTLIEIVMSVGLLAVLAMGVNTYLISSLRSARKAATNAIVKSEGEQIQATIIQAVSFAQRISNDCTATSVVLLDGRGNDVTYTISGGRLVQITDYPSPTPDTTVNLSSTRVTVSNGGDCANVAFNCSVGGRSVAMCLRISSSGVDVTDQSALYFKNYMYTNNN